MLTVSRYNASISRTCSVNLTGQRLWPEQRLLPPDSSPPDWERLTEEDTEVARKVISTYDATNTRLTHTNHGTVTTLCVYDIAGAVQTFCLQHIDGSGLQDIVRRADGAVLSRKAGNKMTQTFVYDPRTQYLMVHRTTAPAGACQDKGPLIRELHYTYNPVGNILSMKKKTTAPVWHSNVKTTGLRENVYDSLYRLVRVTGRELHAADAANREAGKTWSPYTECYTYYDSGNLIQTVHTGGRGNRTVGRVVATGSNRTLKMTAENPVPDPDAGSTAGGAAKGAGGRPVAKLAGRRSAWSGEHGDARGGEMTRSSTNMRQRYKDAEDEYADHVRGKAADDHDVCGGH